MRVELRTPVVQASPGSLAIVELEVFNTTDVIAGITARVVGLDPAWVRSEPEPLALFPETSGLLLLHLDLPPEMPAGTHTLPIELASSIDRDDVASVELTLEVAAVDFALISLDPSNAVGRRRGEMGIVIDNRGNVPLELALSATDPERALRCTVEPPVVTVPPAERVVAHLVLQGRPPFIGSQTTRPITVLARSTNGELQAVGAFTQKPLLARGVATAAVLGAIVALWALVAVFGIGAALTEKPAAKAVPASFFAPGSPATLAGSPGTKGLDPAVVGGAIEGTVVASTDGSGVDRIAVEAVRETRSGPRLAAAAATDEDGAFTISGLLPGSYKLHFTAPGFEELWYPAASSQSTAEPVKVGPKAEPLEVEIAGMPGSLSGRIDSGADDVAATVSLVPIVAGERGQPIDVATTGPDGSFAVAALPTPATYEVVFTADGFQPTSRTEALRGGQHLVLDAIRLSAGDGVISGTVTDGLAALGGVTVTARAGGEEVAATVTPTSGAVGTYVFTDLPTPATYLLAFTKEGYGTETMAVGLGPGEARTDLSVALAGGTGTVTGTVTDTSGRGLGDVAVTILGGPTTSLTASLTSGQVGAWRVTGLPSPGDYTVTFAKVGYVSQTVAVHLDPGGSAGGINVSLAPELGAITGTVRADGGGGLSGVQVMVTDGTTERTTSSATNPVAGGYALESLPPGSYSVTFSKSGYQSRTFLVRLGPGQRAALDASLPPV